MAAIQWVRLNTLDLWETVFASNLVVHMMTGEAYSPVVWAHLLPAAVLLENWDVWMVLS